MVDLVDFDSVFSPSHGGGRLPDVNDGKIEQEDFLPFLDDRVISCRARQNSGASLSDDSARVSNAGDCVATTEALAVVDVVDFDALVDFAEVTSSEDASDLAHPTVSLSPAASVDVAESVAIGLSPSSKQSTATASRASHLTARPDLAFTNGWAVAVVVTFGGFVSTIDTFAADLGRKIDAKLLASVDVGPLDPELAVGRCAQITVHHG